MCDTCDPARFSLFGKVGAVLAVLAFTAFSVLGAAGAPAVLCWLLVIAQLAGVGMVISVTARFLVARRRYAPHAKRQVAAYQAALAATDTISRSRGTGSA